MADPAMQQLNSVIQQLAQVLQGFVGKQSQTQAAQIAAMNKYIGMQERVNKEMETYEATLNKNDVLSKAEQKALDDLLKLKRKEIQLSKELQDQQDKYNDMLAAGKANANDLAKAHSDIQKTTLKLNQATKESTKAHDKFAATSEVASNSLSNLAKNGTLTAAALVWFGKTVSAQARQQLAQVAAADGVIQTSGNIEKALLEQQTLAMKYGVTAADFVNMTKQGRQMFNAMGGTTQGMKELDSTVNSLVIDTGGDYKKALELATNSAKALATVGIKPTRAALEAYKRDVDVLIAQTGMSREEAMRHYDAMSSDTDMVDILRSARVGEREAILASQRALMQNAIAAGMSAEQAQRAAKMLNQMVAAKPIDRIKQAAKVRAVAGAMGIAGGDEAAQAIIAGKRATADQKAALMRFNELTANKMDQMGQGGLGGEIFATTLVDKLGLDDYFGKNSPFSTSIDTLKAPLNNITESITTASNSEIAQDVKSTADIVKAINLMASGDHWGGVLASAISLAVMTLGGGKLLGSLGEKIISKLGSKLAGRAANTVVGEVAGATGVAGAEAAIGGAAAGGAAAAQGGRLAAAGRFAKGVALPAVAAMAGGAAIDWGAGKLGVGGNEVDEEQDDKNWKQASIWEKMQSSIPRGIERLGGLLFLDNLVNQAKSDRIKSETRYFDDKRSNWVVGAPTTQSPTPPNKAEDSQQTSSQRVEAATLATVDKLTSQITKMDVSNDLLKKLTDNADRQTDLLEKQLIALTLTDTEKQDKSTKTNLRGGNKFGSQYNYV